jgi:hypothetical protein
MRDKQGKKEMGLCLNGRTELISGQETLLLFANVFYDQLVIDRVIASNPAC